MTDEETDRRTDMTRYAAYEADAPLQGCLHECITLVKYAASTCSFTAYLSRRSFLLLVRVFIVHFCRLLRKLRISFHVYFSVILTFLFQLQLTEKHRTASISSRREVA